MVTSYQASCGTDRTVTERLMSSTHSRQRTDPPDRMAHDLAQDQQVGGLNVVTSLATADGPTAAFTVASASPWPSLLRSLRGRPATAVASAQSRPVARHIQPTVQRRPFPYTCLSFPLSLPMPVEPGIYLSQPYQWFARHCHARITRGATR